MRADIRRIALPIFPWLNHVFSFQRAIDRRQRSKELAGLMAVDKDMTYRFADKLRRPGSGFNSIAFMRKCFVPCGPRPDKIRIYPSAEFPGSNPEYLAGAFLGKALSDSIIYNSNHSFFDLKFEMAV